MSCLALTYYLDQVTCHVNVFFFLYFVIPNLNGVDPATINKKGSFYEGRTMDSTVGFNFGYRI